MVRVSLPGWLRAALLLPLVVLNTLLHALPLLAVALAKALLPFHAARRACNAALTRLAESWIGVNGWMLDRLTPLRVAADLPAGLRADGHYLVLANHQS